MQRVFLGLLTVGLLAILASDAEAGCRGGRRGGRFLNRRGGDQGRFFQRFRERRQGHEEKAPAKDAPKPKGPEEDEEGNWPLLPNREMIPLPRLIEQ